LHFQRCESICRRVVDRVPVCLDLERNASVGQQLEEIEAERDGERLAATESDIRNAEVRDFACDSQRFIAVELIGPSLVGSRVFTAGNAARAAAIGQLPGDEEGCSVLVYRAPRDGVDVIDLR
jgi:hypothetical protein